MCCNGCWNACDPKGVGGGTVATESGGVGVAPSLPTASASADHSVATKCGHLYCLTCCQTILESDDPTCPICTQASGPFHQAPVHSLCSGCSSQSTACSTVTLCS
jgi:hypothetical protein